MILERPEEIIGECWRLGELSYKLRDYQIPVYEAINRPGLSVVINCARRFGKTTTMLLDAVEYAIKNPGASIGFIAPTQKQIRGIVRPIMRMIFEDAPDHLRPQFNNLDAVYHFGNQSTIRLAGTDGGHAEGLRGYDLSRGYVDEAGMADDLKYIIHDILRPQTLTNGGKIIVASTPPRSPGHYFSFLCEEARTRGNLVEFTIYDNKSITPEKVAEYKAECGGEHTTTWRREYLAQHVIEESASILPEFHNVRGEVVREWPMPPSFHPVAAMDVGFRDNTAYLCGYVDFLAKKLIVTHEMVAPRLRTDQIAERVAGIEKEAFPGRKMYARFSDVDLRLVEDLSSLHSLNFIPTDKDFKEGAINEVRVRLSNRQIIIHPRCKELIFQCAVGVWNKNRSGFERTEETGHCDAIDALVYLVRNAPWNANPYPSLPDGVSGYTHYTDGVNKHRQGLRALESVFGGKK